MITITDAAAAVREEDFHAPFGFKGMSIPASGACPQTAVRLTSVDISAIGAANQSVIWSDSRIAGHMGFTAANNLMFSLTRFAVSLLTGFEFENPGEVIDYILPLTEKHVRQTLGIGNMRQTFIRNALQPVDMAAYILFAKCSGIGSFDRLIPTGVRQALSAHNTALARIPLITYSAGEEDIHRILDGGEALLKVKLGYSPEGRRDDRAMLEWDKERLSLIHRLTEEHTTPYTHTGRIPVYLDANGTYPSMELLLELLEHADRIGLLPRIMMLEEPFDEEYECDVSRLPVRIAADESAHSLADAVRRIDMGYSIIALKPIVKTLTESFRIAEAARVRGADCFCADLTVNPYVLEWNKHFAVRLPPLSPMNIGIIESNGHQNYARWEAMDDARVAGGGLRSGYANGIYDTGGDFEDDLSIFYDYDYYTGMFK
jgi:L-alanine-DL-glutamate epimerase-like enolase superfamily enzyme